MANELLDLIRKKKARIKTLEEEITKLQSELREATGLLLHEGEVGRPSGRTADNPSEGGSSTTWAAAVLRAENKPLHVNDLISGIERQFHRKVRYATLVGNLSRAIKAGKTFKRFGPNVFGLTEWPDGLGLLREEES